MKSEKTNISASCHHLVSHADVFYCEGLNRLQLLCSPQALLFIRQKNEDDIILLLCQNLSNDKNKPSPLWPIFLAETLLRYSSCLSETTKIKKTGKEAMFISSSRHHNWSLIPAVTSTPINRNENLSCVCLIFLSLCTFSFSSEVKPRAQSEYQRTCSQSQQETSWLQLKVLAAVRYEVECLSPD